MSVDTKGVELVDGRDKILGFLVNRGADDDFLMVYFDISHRTLRRWLKEAGINRPRGRPVKVIDAEIERVYNRFMKRQCTQEEAARQLDVSITTLRRRFKRHELRRNIGHDERKERQQLPRDRETTY